MKQIFLALSFLFALIVFTACGAQQNGNQKDTVSVATADVSEVIDNDVVQIYYFHGSIRCETCVAVDEDTHHFLNQRFKDEMESGSIIFKTINIDKNERPDLIKKYKIWGQTMLFIKGDKVVNETESAFQYVSTNPEKWLGIVEAQMLDLLK